MRWLVLAAAAISLSGCGLPPIVTYISYTADVFSYLTTRKTVTDHGISVVLQKDCALLRVLDGPICIEEVEEVVLSDCARFETSHDTAGTRDESGAGDTFTRRPSEAYHQIILRDADSLTLSPVLAGDPQGCFHCRTAPQEEILRPIPVAATEVWFHATPQNLRAEMVSPSEPGAITARRPAEAPISFPLYLALDSDRLTAAGQTAIDAAVTAAGKIGATDLAVTGHAGLVGPDTHNIKLSLRRAKVVSEALVARGIDPARISIANQVEVEPIVATAGDLGELPAAGSISSCSSKIDVTMSLEDSRPDLAASEGGFRTTKQAWYGHWHMP